jgi:hypothetical protein
LNAIKADKEHFDMSKVGPPGYSQCGCIGGFGKLFVRSTYGIITLDDVGHWLSLTHIQKDSLFYALPNGKNIWEKYAEELDLPEWQSDFVDDILCVIKVEHAITMLENLISGKWTF